MKSHLVPWLIPLLCLALPPGLRAVDFVPVLSFASFVGYSRVRAHEHCTRDVLAGRPSAASHPTS